MGYDVFVCSNAFNSETDSTGSYPTLLAFPAKECQYLKQWVLNGDALWPIADHEPAGNAVENLSDSLEVNMSKAHTADPKNFARITLDASWIHYSIRNKNLGDHPIIKGRTKNKQIKNVLLFTAQLLRGSKKVYPFFYYRMMHMM